MCAAVDRHIARLDDGRTLARFYANPRKVRVSVCRWPYGGGGWTARVAPREVEVRKLSRGDFREGVAKGFAGACFGWHPLSALRAVVRALRLAEAQGMPGIDLGLGWAYQHPQARR